MSEDYAQYTIRNVPASLDRLLRRKAEQEAKTLDQVVIEALARGIGSPLAEPLRRDLTEIAGTWHEDPEFDASIADQDRVDL